MPRYRSSGWSSLSLHFVGSLVVFAIAALSGAVMGGVSVYIINDAINPPPPAQASADGLAPPVSKQAKASGSQTSSAQPQSAPKPVASPAASQAKPLNDSQAATQDVPKGDAIKQDAAKRDTMTQDAAQQSAQKPSPDAVSRAHPTAAGAAAADSAPHGVAAAQTDAKNSDDADTKSGPARTATDNATDAVRKKPTVAKKRVAVTSARRFTPGASELAQSGSQRSLYDYYAGQQRRSFVQTRQRVIVRRQDNFDDGWDDRNRPADRSAFPAQPRSSFFGFSGRARFNDRNDNW